MAGVTDPDHARLPVVQFFLGIGENPAHPLDVPAQEGLVSGLVERMDGSDQEVAGIHLMPRVEG